MTRPAASRGVGATWMSTAQPSSRDRSIPNSVSSSRRPSLAQLADGGVPADPGLLGAGPQHLRRIRSGAPFGRTVRVGWVVVGWLLLGHVSLRILGAGRSAVGAVRSGSGAGWLSWRLSCWQWSVIRSAIRPGSRLATSTAAMAGSMSSRPARAGTGGRPSPEDRWPWSAVGCRHRYGRRRGARRRVERTGPRPRSAG